MWLEYIATACNINWCYLLWTYEMLCLCTSVRFPGPACSSLALLQYEIYAEARCPGLVHHVMCATGYVIDLIRETISHYVIHFRMAKAHECPLAAV